VQWTLNVPTDGVTAPCVANLVVSDVQFINDGAPAPTVSYTFDTSPQGWVINDFQDTMLTNLGAPGATTTPPQLLFDPMGGDPTPGAIQVTVPFSDFGQYVDAIVNLPQPINLAGSQLHARVRMVAGAFPDGGLQLHASSAPTFAFTGNFLGADQFPVGQWVPVTLDLTSGTGAGFDPTQVVQIGVQFFSGAVGGGGTFQGSASVFEIDTVTN